jgi:hypothetical protein
MPKKTLRCDGCGEKIESPYYYTIAIDPISTKTGSPIVDDDKIKSRSFNVCIVCNGLVWMEMKQHIKES